MFLQAFEQDFISSSLETHMSDIIDCPAADKGKFFRYISGNSYLSARHKLLYIATPKVACTSLKWWFAELEGYAQVLREDNASVETDPELVIHDTFHKVAPNVTGLSPETLQEPLTSKTHFRFAVVRNPYRRIFSAWQSKLLLREPLQVEPYLNSEFFNLPLENSSDIAKAFEGFLEHLAANEAPNYWDVHWTPQVSLLRPDLIEYSKLVKIENTKELSSALAEWIGPKFVDPFATRSANESLIPYLPDLVTERSAELIRSLYAEDFETFDYSKQPPDEKETFSADQFKLALKAIGIIHGRHQRIGEMRKHFNQTVAARDAVIAERDAAIDGIYTSLSWRLTKPLRFITRLSRKIRITFIANRHHKHGGECYQACMLATPKTKRLRIVHVIGNFMTGGSSRLVVDLFEHLGHLYEQEVVTQYNPVLPNYTGIPVHEYKRNQSPEFAAYLRQFQPELVHIHYWGSADGEWYASMIDATLTVGCKVLENINTPVKPYVDRGIDRYVYVSNYVRNTFGAREIPSLTIYPGSNFDLFSRGATQTIPDDCIGMVYRLDVDKLNKNSIDVFIKVVQKRPQTKVIIVGGGPLLRSYKAAVKAHRVENAFNFTDFVSYEKLPALYAQMSIFVAPVWKESFGQVSPFAMSMGIPVVGYNVGALAEILGDDSLLAPPGDSDALAKIIIRLLDDRQLREQIGQRNRERAHRSFSIESMIKSYAKLYSELIENKK